MILDRLLVVQILRHLSGLLAQPPIHSPVTVYWNLCNAVGRLGRRRHSLTHSLTHPLLGVLKGAAAVPRLNEGCGAVARVLDRYGRYAAPRRSRRMLHVRLSIGRGREKWGPFKGGLSYTQKKESGALRQVGTSDATH